jgi:serine protease Do
LPEEASRRVRVLVARGSMPYSAVTQPRPWPLSHGGRRSSRLAVTSFHLIAGHEEIWVDCPDAPPVRAEVVGADALTDLAVLRFPPPEGLRALPIGDSSRVEQGDWVVVIGCPFTYRDSVTVGVISHVGRHLTDEAQQVSNELLQFSAPIHPGTSGAPLLDLAGTVVGVVTAGHSGGPGISFAVPSKVLRWVIESLERDGRVRRGHLGLALEPLDRATARALALEPEHGGALVARVSPRCPAERAGLRAGDVIVAWDNHPVADPYALFDAITFTLPGTRVPVEVLRAGVRLAPLVAELGELPPAAPQRESKS